MEIEILPTYSTANFVFFCYVFFWREIQWYPIAICSTISLNITWYTTILFIDRTIPFRMMEKYNWSIPLYIIGELALHFIPCIISLQRLVYLPPYFCSSCSSFGGVYTALANLMWSCIFHGGFEPNDAYVFLKYWQWNLVWTLAIICHLSTMYVINKFICQ